MWDGAELDANAYSELTGKTDRTILQKQQNRKNEVLQSD
jgi:hypothetical protein